MNYYYDIKLNFLEDNVLYYEWDELDNIEYIKKIPLFQVSSQTFNDFYGYNIKVTKEFLKEIENKTLKMSGKLKYACILADKNSAFAYEFADNGKIISRSSLTLKDELSLLEYLYTISPKEITYEKENSLIISEETRLGKKIKHFINIEIDLLYKEKSFEKLEFLYLEWFNKKEKSMNKIYKNMKNRLKKEIDEKELHIYNLIKLSYNNV